MATAEIDPARWVERHGDVMYRYALARVRDASVAENSVQEAFVAGLKGKESFSGRSSERTWLMGILKHKIYDHFRKVAREMPAEDIESMAEAAQPFDEKGHWTVGPRAWREPDAAVEAADFWKVLQVCIDEMPQRLAMAFTLREMDQISTKETCNILDVTQTNLGVMMHRARARLRGCLELNWFGDDSAEDIKVEE